MQDFYERLLPRLKGDEVPKLKKTQSRLNLMAPISKEQRDSIECFQLLEYILGRLDTLEIVTNDLFELPVKEKEKRLDSSDADELLSLRCKVASMTEFSEKYDLLQLELENSTRNLTSLASANESEKEIFRLGLCDIGNFLLICI